MNPRQETLSALVDDELSPGDTERVLAELTADPALRETWARYQLIGTAIRRGVPEVHDPALAERIAAAVAEAEPDEADVSVPPVAAATLRGGRLRRAASGFAMAASVAAVALFGVRYLAAPDPQIGEARVATLAPPAIQAQPVAAGTSVAETTPLDEQRLNDYLQRHNELALGGGLRTLPPYVRVVSASGPAVAR